jgi:acetyl esterase
VNPSDEFPKKPSWIAKLLGDAYKPGTPITDVDAIPARREAIGMASINQDLPDLAAIHEDVVLRERDGRRLTAEIYVPNGEGPFPTVAFFHGGAWCVWSPADVRRTATRIAAAGHLVVSVDYGLAPECKYPVAVEDALYGTRWAVAHGAEYGGDGGPIVVAGDSAGATLSCGVISYLAGMPGRELDEGDLAGQAVDFSAALLLYGVYDFGTKMLQRDTTPGTTEIMFNLAYLGTNFLKFHAEPLVSPMRAPNLDSFPPVYLNVGAEDALLTQSLEMTQAFADAGVSTTLSVVAGVDHEFLQLDPKLPHVADEWSRLLRWLAAHTGAKDVEAALAGLPVAGTVAA